jgi:RNA polymerase sigma-70 factor (family 1)
MGHPAFRLHFNCFSCDSCQLYCMKGLVPAYRFLLTTETIGWHPSNNVVATIIFSLIYNRLNLNAASPYEGNALLHRIAAGDEQSFRSLFDLYKNRFYLVALKMTRSETVAEELVQEIFFKIWRNRGSLVNIENADAYLFTIAYREIYRYFKKLALEKKMQDVLSTSPVLENVTDETVLAQERERLLNEAVSKLPSQQQRVFKLARQDGLTRQQIANQLQISPNTVRNHLADAIKSIKSRLGFNVILYVVLAGVVL